MKVTSTSAGVVFASTSMLAVLRTVKQIAPLDVNVLITGETGSGKEVIAKTIHDYSKRSGMPFLPLNCAAVPKDLLESQLFGHRKGAFSGATENHQGIVRAANGGTLFLDEIGELPLDLQAKLLRFLEMSEVHPVGDSHPVKVNVRLLFATNGDLEEAVNQNRFRQDLFYRLNVIPIKVPPLRERREEIPVLANLFAQRFAAEFAKDPVRFSSGAMERLILYSWPGNIRQLANEIRRLTALSESSSDITPDQLSTPSPSPVETDARRGIWRLLEHASAHRSVARTGHGVPGDRNDQARAAAGRWTYVRRGVNARHFTQGSVPETLAPRNHGFRNAPTDSWLSTPPRAGVSSRAHARIRKTATAAQLSLLRSLSVRRRTVRRLIEEAAPPSARQMEALHGEKR